jgi:hypothetical protein
MAPVPARWKGACEAGQEFKASMCNRKLIGARSFSKGLKQRGLTIAPDDYDSPRDYYGHGSHTSSTAAGAAVSGASYFGYANGTATGIAPKARVAMYKAVFSSDTLESASTDVLAAMDQAIADGVDVMSLSLGFPETSYDTNVIAIGAFAAMQRGIFVACSAGNDGSDGYSILNGAPWITTVGAASVDRDFTATVTLGSGATVQGKSVYPLRTPTASANLYYGRGNSSKQRCESTSLRSKDVRGKYVFCSADPSTEIEEQMDEVQSKGGLGAIIASDMKQFLEQAGGAGHPVGRRGHRQVRDGTVNQRGAQGERPVRRHGAGRQAGADRVLLLLPRAGPDQPDDPEAGRHRARGGHPGGVGAQQGDHGARQEEALHQVRAHLRHVHVIAARRRRGRPPAVSAP